MVTAETKPVWNSSSFLIYLGGLTVLQAAIGTLVYLAMQFQGAGQETAWSLLIFIILAAIANGFLYADRWLAAGIFAFDSVIAWAVFVVVALHWFGWENGRFTDVRVWSWPRLLAEILVLLAAAVVRWRFTFPLISLISAGVGALFVMDLLTSGHGNWLAVVSILVGLAYLGFGYVSDNPSTFWLHVFAGLLIGIPILYWFNTSSFDFAVVAFMSLVYVAWAFATKRSSWAVFGTIGFFIVTTYFLVKAVEDTARSASPFGGPGSVISGLWYIPLAIGLLGFWFVLLGMAGRRKKNDPVTTETKPVWTSSSFLIYTGGLTVLLGAAVGLVYLGYEDRGDGARVGWTLLFLVIVYGIAHALRLGNRWLAAGIFAFVSVFVWATLVLLTMRWIGWHPFNVFRPSYGGSPLRAFIPHSPFDDWSWSRLLFWVLVLAAALYDRLVFKFPFIRYISVSVFTLLVADVLTSGHGNWFEVVTLLTGLVYLLAGSVIDKPSAFWLHFAAAGLIGGVLVHWFSTSDFDFAVLSIFALAFVLVGYRTRRSIWAVYGALGFFAATYHYLGLLPSHTGLLGSLLNVSQQCTSSGVGLVQMCTPGQSVSLWAAMLGFGLLGFWLVGLGVLGAREKSDVHAAVVVQIPAPLAGPEPPAAADPPPDADPPAE